MARVMTTVRLGAVAYLNARPLVDGLSHSSAFSLRFDVPSRCADLLHTGAIDVGLIPSIEYLRSPAGASYSIVPDLAIASNGPVASVAIYTTRPMSDVRSIALDASSRTSVALVRVLCARLFGIRPSLEHSSPDLPGASVSSGGTPISLEPDPVRVAMEPLTTDEIGRLWALFPTVNYRPSVAYVVSPVWIDPPLPAVPPPDRRVLRDSLRAAQGAPLQTTP